MSKASKPSLFAPTTKWDWDEDVLLWKQFLVISPTYGSEQIAIYMNKVVGGHYDQASPLRHPNREYTKENVEQRHKVLSIIQYGEKYEEELKRFTRELEVRARESTLREMEEAEKALVRGKKEHIMRLWEEALEEASLLLSQYLPYNFEHDLAYDWTDCKSEEVPVVVWTV